MKLTVHKLGRIEDAEIDIRPLTVFIGPNGTNKTWTAYALYGLMRTFAAGPDSALQLRISEPDKAQRERLMSMLGPLLDTLANDPPPARVEATVQLGLLNAGLPDAHGVWFGDGPVSNLISVPRENVSGVHVQLQLAVEEFTNPIVAAEIVLERPLNRMTVRCRRSSGDAAAEAVLTGGPWTGDAILDFVTMETQKSIEHVVVFPAERKGLLSTLHLLSRSVETTLPVPLSDFVQWMRIGQGMTNDLETPASLHLQGLLSQVIGGDLVYPAAEPGGALVFRMASGAVLPLLAASSLSRAVAGLSVYLRRFLHADDFLVIDELEMNAHPEAQLALMELVAAIVQQGVRVLITTHSPYIVDHLNNLMEAARVSEDKQAALAKSFALRTPEVFIPSEKVAVHLFDEGQPGGPVTVKDVLDRQTGLIDWGTFGRVTNHVSDIYNDVLSALAPGK